MTALARDPGLLIVYPTHGTPTHVWLQGRFIEDEHIKPARASDNKLKNTWRTLRQLESDEIEGARIQVQVGTQTFTVVTDDDGVFQVEGDVAGAPLSPGPQLVRAVALDDKGHHAPPGTGYVHILPAAPSVAVISDIDDTVVVSNITSKRKMIKTALTTNAAQMRATPGTAEALRRAVQAGAVGVFYLSGSPQNFLLRLQEFFQINGFPEGPVMLKNFGTDPTFDQTRYKTGRLETILAAHPQTRFVLVGDSGEHDPEIYRGLRDRFPGRIQGIFIREVPGGDNRPERFEGITRVPDFSAQPDLLARAVQPTP
ncbi:MAG: phosphatase domain-containing protein [bacterium]